MKGTSEVVDLANNTCNLLMYTTHFSLYCGVEVVSWIAVQVKDREGLGFFLLKKKITGKKVKLCREN
jgi:hypothetical protein